jgi:paraquat-inducible protein B
MAKQASKKMIGSFVVIAVILMAASLAVFGSGKFFKTTQKCILYFDGSIQGLTVGAQVLFQGVKVGSVTSIVIYADLANMKTQIPVIIEIEPDRFKVSENKAMLKDFRANVSKLVEKGLRAVLTIESYVTGQLMIGLDFQPKTPINLKNTNQDYIEIPTAPSTIKKLSLALEKLDLDELQKRLESSLAGIDKLANSQDLTDSIRGLKDTLQDTRKLVTRVDRQVDPVAKDMKKTVKDIGKLARDADARVEELAPGLKKTIATVRGVISEDSPVMVELENTLKEISVMSRSIRELADYLEQHPETLIRGKEKPKGKKL